MKKKIIYMCMALFIPNIFLVAQPKIENFEGMENRMVHKLKLTEEQTKKFNELSSSFKKEMVDLKAKIEKNRIDLKSMLESGTVEEKNLLALTESNIKLRGEIQSLAVKRWIDVNKILDKDQKAIWAKSLNKFAELNKMKVRFRGMFNQKRFERMHESREK